MKMPTYVLLGEIVKFHINKPFNKYNFKQAFRYFERV